MNKDLEFNIRTVIGFLLILLGLTGGAWMAWWLSFEENVVEIIHLIKLDFPSWVWTSIKFLLAGFFGLLFLMLFVIFAIAVFSGGRKKRIPKAD